MRRYLQPSAYHGRGAEPEALGTENGALDHVQAGLQPTIRLQPDLVAQIVGTQRLLCLAQTQFPGEPA